MPTIGIRTLKEAAEMIRGNLINYQAEIDEAYCRLDESLTISLKAKFSPNKEGIKTETFIDFVTDKIKDKSVRIINENQMSLPESKSNRDRWREILFRNFDELRRILALIDIQRRWKEPPPKINPLLFRRFD